MNNFEYFAPEHETQIGHKKAGWQNRGIRMPDSTEFCRKSGCIRMAMLFFPKNQMLYRCRRAPVRLSNGQHFIFA